MSDSTFRNAGPLAIGVTGHRTLSAPDAVRTAVETVFGRVEAMAPAEAGAPRLVVISPLAEGADRLVAEAGLARGAALICPLPLPMADYEADFADADSRRRFRQLLAAAETVVHLGGDPAERTAAYEAAGRAVCAHADVLIAIWDGQPQRGRGGTAQIIAEALADGLPVVWIDPGGQRPPALLGGTAAEPKPLALDGLADAIAARHAR